MFTVEQIQAAHSKVRTGADFPAYIQEIKALGVTHYVAFVDDGHTDYYGMDGQQATVPAKYAPVAIADKVDLEEFKAELLAHQQGRTDYPEFIKMCAGTGIDKWEIRMDRMTCTYYDKAGGQVLVEQVPH